MPSHRIRARPPRGVVRPELIDARQDTLRQFLEDAAHYPEGRAAGVAFPENEAEVAALLRCGLPLLPIGAQSSLTGGATPMGEVVLSTASLNQVALAGHGGVRAGAGVTLDVLQEALRPHGVWYPPVPTYAGACCGGVVATNAAGPATFKYGSTRRWVRGLTVVVATGEVVEIHRGETTAHADGYFEIETAGRLLRVPVADLPWPAVPKCSAGYFLTAGMDLVDLLVGSEGTLAVVTEVVFDLAPRPAATCLAVVALASETEAVALAGDLRRESQATWRSGDPRGLDVAAIEHIDAPSIALLREDGLDRRHDLAFPMDTEMALFVELELSRPVPPEDAWRQIEDALEASAPDTPLTRFCRLLAARGLLERTELALPGDDRRAEQLRAVREAVPTTVNQRVARARASDPRISKTAADVVVPFDRFGEMTRACLAELTARNLGFAAWGHISDGNVHANVLPRSYEDAARGGEAILAIGREVIRLGGSPLAEHGVGRNPIKRELLRLLHGQAGLDAMRRVKAALDPGGVLAPGVLV